MRSVRFSAVSAAAAAFLVGFTEYGSAGGPEMTLRFTNHAQTPVLVELYSPDRAKSWPDDGQLFLLDDSSPRKFTIGCELGEKICYGAWQEGDINHSWGAGYEGKKDCDDCCHICEAQSLMPLYQVTLR